MSRILVVEDDAVFRLFLRRVLEGEGYEVVEAADGAEGLQQYQAAPVALVITDLQMPVMDGLALLRALFQLASPPVVLVLSGNASALVQARAFTPYTFMKPLALEPFLATVHALMDVQPP